MPPLLTIIMNFPTRILLNRQNHHHQQKVFNDRSTAASINQYFATVINQLVHRAPSYLLCVVQFLVTTRELLLSSGFWFCQLNCLLFKFTNFKSYDKQSWFFNGFLCCQFYHVVKLRSLCVAHALIILILLLYIILNAKSQQSSHCSSHKSSHTSHFCRTALGQNIAQIPNP